MTRYGVSRGILEWKIRIILHGEVFFEKSKNLLGRYPPRGRARALMRSDKSAVLDGHGRMKKQAS